jgi:hypothetical protein
MNKADARKRVRDASVDRVKAGGEVVPAGRKTAHDASQAGGEAVRQALAATGLDVIERSAKTAEQHLQEAAEGLRSTIARSSDMVSEAAVASQRVAGRSAEEFSEVSAKRLEAAKEVVGRTQQNLGTMMQTGTRLASGFQSVMREWADYTRNAVQCNIDGVNAIMRARTPEELMAAQSNLLNAEVQLMLTSGARISEATARVAKDVAQSMGERTQKRDPQNS